MSARRIYTPDGHPAWKIEEPARAHIRDRVAGYGSISGWWLTLDTPVRPEDAQARAELARRRKR